MAILAIIIVVPLKDPLIGLLHSIEVSGGLS
jgi:hypothetical protein